MSGLFLLNINLTSHHLAFPDIIMLLDDPPWTILLLTPTILFLGEVFQCIVGHDNDDLGVFGKFNCFICATWKGCCVVWEGCCIVVKDTHKAVIRGCAHLEAGEREEENSIVVSPPCYSVSLHYIYIQVTLLISHFISWLVLMKWTTVKLNL